MEETIAAIAGAFGEGGIGIIRISGDRAEEIIGKIFSGAAPGSLKNRKITYGNVVDPISKKITDEVLCVFMKGPKTYTTEDVVEIYCHGGVIPLKKTLELVLRNGARLAEPGEFTKRAFLNGRLDLSQAEAVIDLIKAKTDKSFDVALNQLEGFFSKEIAEIREKIVDILVNITVNIDYPDEDIEEITYDALRESTVIVKDRIKALLESSQTGRIMKEGLAVAIIGKPNVGKSSLMNCLLRESRAIVTEIPGTTRDTIEEALSIRGIPVILTDTAGIRETTDIIEKIGIEKSKESFNNADLIILILDSSRALSEEDYEIIEKINGRKTIVIFNKIDLKPQTAYEEIEKLIPNATIIKASLERREGVEELEEEIERLVYGGKISQENSLMVTNLRHIQLLETAEKSLADAIEMIDNGEALEFIEIDVNSAYENLGEIIGETVQDDILSQVFSRFCLGK